MKNVIISFMCFWTLSAHAGPSVSGGMPPAPRAVVIQSYLVNGQFDLAGRDKVLKYTFTDMRKGIVEVIAERTQNQSPDRGYICIEYSSFQDYANASNELKSLLAGHPSIEVVQNNSCR